MPEVTSDSAVSVASTNPRVTISLVAYNGAKWLEACLASVASQTLADYELLIVDNSSTDESLEILRRHSAADGRARVFESATNLGFAKAHNRSIEAARGDYVILLNQDVVLDDAFVAVVVATFEHQPRVGAVQGHIGRLGQDGARLAEIDTTGLVMQRDRRVVSRDQGRSEGTVATASGPVWGVDGPVAAYRRAALVDARLPRRYGGWEVLDEDFFMYKEDVDLAWRLRLLGWEAAYAPTARAWHARTASGPTGTGWLNIASRNRATPRWIRSLSWRNQRLMQIKNESASEFMRDLPWIGRRELLSIGYIIVADPGQLVAVPELLRGLPGALTKRRYLWDRLTARARLASESRSDR